MTQFVIRNENNINLTEYGSAYISGTKQSEYRRNVITMTWDRCWGAKYNEVLVASYSRTENGEDIYNVIFNQEL